MKNNSIMVHKSVYQMAIVTLVGSLFWAGLGIYGSVKKTDYVEVDKEMLAKLDPTIDEETVNNIFARRDVLKGADLSLLEEPVVVIEEQAPVTPEATGSAQVNETSPEATGSATVNEVAVPEATGSAETAPGI